MVWCAILEQATEKAVVRECKAARLRCRIAMAGVEGISDQDLLDIMHASKRITHSRRAAGEWLASHDHAGPAWQEEKQLG